MGKLPRGSFPIGDQFGRGDNYPNTGGAFGRGLGLGWIEAETCNSALTNYTVFFLGY
jgi:hypothetical protein